MFKEFFHFEIKNRFRQPVIYIFLIFLATISDNITVGGSTGNVNINLPYVLMFYPAIMTLIALLMTTAFMNTAALRDYSVKFDQILFSTPLRKLDFLGGRFLGALVASVIPLLGVYLAIWIAGFTPWVDAEKVGPFYGGAYLSSLLAFVIPNTIFIVAAMLIQILVNNKYLGYFVFLVFIIANSFIWRPLEISSNLAIFSGVPSHTYSDMNAWGPLEAAKNWFHLYWMAFCGLLLLGGVLMWVRGQSNSFRQRLEVARQQINGRGVLVALVLGLIWVGTGGFLYYNTKVVNTITSSKAQERRAVDYEKAYLKYQGIPPLMLDENHLSIFSTRRPT